MLILRRVEIENFACFASIAVEPSTDPNRPLTVIRAENGSGKTTFLRAVRWGMYGEKGLPEPASHFSLHPASWHPDEPEVETRVSIEFETDGSSRDFEGTGESPSLYRLDRATRTIGKTGATNSEPDFLRVGEAATLMVKTLGGQWSKHEKSPDAVIDELLPWDLRDFFIMDTDEAADFVGGSENKPVSRQDYQAKTTDAISSLLGLQVFKGARDRVEASARGFAAKATKAIGDHDLNQLQEKLEAARAEKQQTESEVQSLKSKKEDLADRLQRLEHGIEEAVGRLSAYNSWSDRLRRNREEYQRAVSERANSVTTLSEDLESAELLASLASTAISETHNFLEPLYEQGRIPVAHLPFVRRLLHSGRCICGQDLSEDADHRHHVEGLVAAADEEASRADYLHHLYQACLSLRDIAGDSAWNKKKADHAAILASCLRRLSELETEKKDLDTKLDEVDQVKIQIDREAMDAVKKQLEIATRDLLRCENGLQGLEETVESLTSTIAQRQRNEVAAADHRASEEMARLVVNTLDRAYAAIEQQQVASLSKRMNLLFHEMAANVSDADFDEAQHGKGNLRMIVEVGVRPVEDTPESFEIYALNSRGRAMPPVEINGASRRVLALSFILALCDESNTHAPLLADSLLNFMSGAVRRNTLRATAEHSRQPILLLTSSDLETASELETVLELAHATYTLTGQWDAIGSGSGGDVVNRTQENLVSLLCRCGPREYCSVCERTGQAEAAGWTKQQQ